VPLEISPEPTPEEREVLLRALAALDGRVDHMSAWWEAGIQDAVADLDDGQFPSGEGPSGLSPVI
jgi:hypothetical protein